MPPLKNEPEFIENQYSGILSLVPACFKLDFTIILSETHKAKKLYEIEDEVLETQSEHQVYEISKMQANLNCCEKLWKNFKNLLMLERYNVSDVDTLQQLILCKTQVVLALKPFTGSLAEALAEKSISREGFKKIFLDITRAIKNLHEMKIVHRCLLPRKIKFVFAEGIFSAFISDFSFASGVNQISSDELLPISTQLYTRDRDIALKGNPKQDIYSLLVMILNYFLGPDFLTQVNEVADLKTFCQKLLRGTKLKRCQKWVALFLSQEILELPSLHKLKIKIKATL